MILACRNSNISKVKELLESLKVSQLNENDPSTGNTALHEAAINNNSELIEILLNTAICRSIRNHKNLTAYQLTNQKPLFHRHSIDRFISIGSDDSVADSIITAELMPLSTSSTITIDWSLIEDDVTMVTEKAIKFHHVLDNKLKYNATSYGAHLEYDIRQWTKNIKDIFITRYLYQSKHLLLNQEHEKLTYLFEQAIESNNVRYLVTAYTVESKFYKIFNQYLAKYLLSAFNSEEYNYIKNQDLDVKMEYMLSITWLASILCHSPLLVSQYQFTGTVYRGMRITNHELQKYKIDRYILTKSFLSTSKSFCVADEIYANGNDQLSSSSEDDRIVFCTYTIRNQYKQMVTAIQIDSMSEFEEEDEVLIFPLVPFQIRDIQENNQKKRLEIKLEDCESMSYVQPQYHDFLYANDA
ncbi:unnamed protein product [Rotaria sp. Silwood1]|nr:unnamed protein product [Rotaria sp. Silwood1]CAF1553654.1 unnamed protein product [Rotaria sp. Silwood1]CAF3581226.1 unnamed protein product [Rotaria sp. Silwood1]CAF3635302.1 unnamed protein product [Rotaria sp. Silwood1]CAF3680334.1 unnamed protein product [Rotaria sp. Silwood1]